MRKRNILTALIALVALSASAAVYDLRCEGLRRPLGIDTTSPHFSWKHELTHNGQRQTAYEIQVGSDSAALVRGRADVWKSGRVASADQVMVAYGGTPLQERQLCYWRVRTWDERGRRSAWSGVERFAVGVLTTMKGEFIALRAKKDNGPQNGGPVFATTPMFRKTIQIGADGLRGPVIAHVNSLGYHELFVNGQRVGDNVLQPAMSQLDRRSLIVSYDLTPYLHSGENEITIWVGQGWNRQSKLGSRYEGALVKAEVSMRLRRGSSGLNGLSGSMLQSSGWQTLVQTDATWQASESGYSYTGSWNPLDFGGERLDANAKPMWQQAEVVAVEGVQATPQLFDGNLITDTLAPKTITPQPDGSLLLDFGRVVTGWLKADFQSLQQGQEVTMDYTDYIPVGSQFASQGEKDFYVACGRGDESFCNKFHHHSFRYVLISNARVKDVKALQISVLSEKGASTFDCSDQQLTAVHDLIHYTLRCLTFSGYMVDCPHLERMGYGGDGNSSTMTLQTMYDVAPTFMNWLVSWGDLMDEDGSMPHTAPAGRDGGGPYWCGFIVKAPWRTYQNYGDRRLLERYYDHMKRWLGYVQKWSKDGLLERWPDTDHRTWFLGDWLAPRGVDVGGESVFHVNNCFVSECLDNMTTIAALLGHDDDARYYAAWRQRLNAAIHQRFYHPETHTYANGTPLDQSYALLAGIPADEAERQQVAAQLVADSYGKYQSHIAVGLVGVPIFTQWATEARQTDLMATILRQTDYPGYLNMIAHGATTTWESWDAERSRVHNCYNGIGTWFYQALAGIRPDAAAPGYRHFFVDPQPAKGVSRVKASKPTPYGDICVELSANGGLQLTVPVGTTATVYPGTPREQKFEAGVHTLK